MILTHERYSILLISEMSEPEIGADFLAISLEPHLNLAVLHPCLVHPHFACRRCRNG